MGFPLVPTSVTLNDPEWHYGQLWPFFGVFFGTYCVKMAEARPILSGIEM